MKFILSCGLVLICAALVCSQDRDTPTSIVETGYHVAARKVIFVVVATNPFEDKFASRPSVRVTLRGSDGSIIASQEKSSAGIPPKGIIAFADSVYFDERPTSVEIRPTAAGYEPTLYRQADFRPFELLNVRGREGAWGIQVTGEVRNPYSEPTGVWITFVFRNEQKKIVGGRSYWLSELLAGDPTSFQFTIDADDLPRGITSIDRLVFSHNNYQSSWRKLLGR